MWLVATVLDNAGIEGLLVNGGHVVMKSTEVVNLDSFGAREDNSILLMGQRTKKVCNH